MAHRGTTPDYNLYVSGWDLTSQSVYVMLKQGRKAQLTLSGDRLSIMYNPETQMSTVSFRLNQEETLGFKAGVVEVQIRFVDEDGIAEATNIKTVSFQPILEGGVIEYAEQ